MIGITWLVAVLLTPAVPLLVVVFFDIITVRWKIRPPSLGRRATTIWWANWDLGCEALGFNGDLVLRANT